MNDVIKRGKHSVLKKTTNKENEIETFINEVRLQIGLRLTSTSEGTFIHITSDGETTTTKLTEDATDPLVQKLHSWAKELVGVRTYN